AATRWRPIATSPPPVCGRYAPVPPQRRPSCAPHFQQYGKARAQGGKRSTSLRASSALRSRTAMCPTYAHSAHRFRIWPRTRARHRLPIRRDQSARLWAPAPARAPFWLSFAACRVCRRAAPAFQPRPCARGRNWHRKAWLGARLCIDYVLIPSRLGFIGVEFQGAKADLGRVETISLLFRRVGVVVRRALAPFVEQLKAFGAATTRGFDR